MSPPKIKSHMAQNHFSYCAEGAITQFFKVPQKERTPVPMNHLCVPNIWQQAEPVEVQKISAELTNWTIQRMMLSMPLFLRGLFFLNQHFLFNYTLPSTIFR